MQAKIDLNSETTYFPDKYEVLIDENIKLKGNHIQLEDQVKIIAAKLRR